MKIILWLLFVTAISIYSGTATAQQKWETKGTLQVTSTVFPWERDTHSHDQQVDFLGKWLLAYDSQDFFSFYLEPRVKIDPNDSERNRYLPDDATIRGRYRCLDLKAGMQRVDLGVSEFYRPLNVLNRRDYADNAYVPPDLGELMLDMSCDVPFHMGKNRWQIRAFVLPLFLETHLPSSSSRFAIAGRQNGIGYTLADDQDHPNSLDKIGVALESKISTPRVDLSLLFYHGPEKDPGFQLIIDNNGALRLLPFYYITDSIGGTARWQSGIFIWRAEAVARITSNNNFRAHDIAPVDQNAVPHNSFAFVLGGEMDFGKWINKGKLRLVTEYLGDHSQGDGYYALRPFDHDLLFSLQYLFGDTRNSSAQMALIKDVINRDAVIAASISSQVLENLGVSLEALWRTAAAGSPLDFYGNNSFFRLSFTGSFGKRW